MTWSEKEKEHLDHLLLRAIKHTAGIVEVLPLFDEDRREILQIESEAEKKSLMGLGKVVNTGVRQILTAGLVYVALTDMDFDWGCDPTLVMKKGPDLVGEEVRDEAKLHALSQLENVWFLHKNFVIYKDRVQFPQDVMQKVCHFEIPGLPARWCQLEDEQVHCETIMYANPCTLCDVYLKERYFQGNDRQGTGTILVGALIPET